MKYKLTPQGFRIAAEMNTRDISKLLVVSLKGGESLNLKDRAVLMIAAKNGGSMPRPVEIQTNISRPTYWRMIKKLLKIKAITEDGE